MKLPNYAFPHEAGHVVVARKLDIPVEYIALRMKGSEGTLHAKIGAEGETPEYQRDSYCTALAGGIAGEQFFQGWHNCANEGATSADRTLLATLTTRDIMEFVPAAKEIIHKNRRVFRQLCSRMNLRHPEVRKLIEQSNHDGVFVLVTKAEIEELCG